MNDCTDLVAKGENTIFKVLYMCSLKLRRCADLIFLNLRHLYSYYHRQNDCYRAQDERADSRPPRREIIFDKNRRRRRDRGLRA